MKKIFLLLITVSCAANAVTGQAQSTVGVHDSTCFVLGMIEKIQSVVLGESRTLNIFLPEDYTAANNTRYPVIYLLDGSANEDFIHIVGIVQFLTMIGDMPKTIVVGIANIDRRRDFTFPTTIEKDKKDFPSTGSSSAFMTFIEKELQPFIQKKYKTSYTTIIGQSLGGLFATETLLKKPALFDNYMIVSPSLWWNNESLLTAAPGLLKNQAGKKINVYISVGTEGKQMEDDAKQLAGLLESAPGKNFWVNFLPLPDENHLTILHNSVYKGLKILNDKKERLNK